MRTNYNKAYSDLLKLVEEIEDDSIQLDTLAAKVKQAKELIEFCENSLRKIDADVNTAMEDKKKHNDGKTAEA